MDKIQLNKAVELHADMRSIKITRNNLKNNYYCWLIARYKENYGASDFGIAHNLTLEQYNAVENLIIQYLDENLAKIESEINNL